MVELYRQRFEHYGHGSADQAIVGLGGQVFMRKNSAGRRARVPAVLRQRPGLRPRPVAGGVHRADAADRRQPAAGHRPDARLPRLRRRLPAPAVPRWTTPACRSRPCSSSSTSSARGRAGAAQGVRRAAPGPRAATRRPTPRWSRPAARTRPQREPPSTPPTATPRRASRRVRVSRRVVVVTRRAEPAVVDPAARRPAGRGRRPPGRARRRAPTSRSSSCASSRHDLADHLLDRLPDARAAPRLDDRSPAPTALIAVTPVFSASLQRAVQDVLRRARRGRAGRQAGAARRHRRHGPALARARPRAAAAVRLPARGRRADRRVRGHRGLRRRRRAETGSASRDRPRRPASSPRSSWPRSVLCGGFGPRCRRGQARTGEADRGPPARAWTPTSPRSRPCSEVIPADTPSPPTRYVLHPKSGARQPRTLTWGRFVDGGLDSGSVSDGRA